MSEEKEQRTAGWYVGMAAFWLGTAWIITAGLMSIIPQIFVDPGEGAAATAACAPELRKLRSELLARSAESVSAPQSAGDRQDLERWLKDWDDRLTAISPSCASPEQTKAHQELARLRHGVRSLIQRFDKEQAPRIRKMDKLLGPPAQARAR